MQRNYEFMSRAAQKAALSAIDPTNSSSNSEK
jgi:hypothetical protein